MAIASCAASWNGRARRTSLWRSGDLGSKDAAGFVRVLDRNKHMSNRGGHKVYSLEVENPLMSCPGVLKSHCARLLADYKVPDGFTLLGRPLRRNVNGKVLKRELKANALMIAGRARDG